MNSEPLFDDLIGVMAVITMVPVFFLWLGEDVGDVRMQLPENAVLRWPVGSVR